MGKGVAAGEKIGTWVALVTGFTLSWQERVRDSPVGGEAYSASRAEGLTKIWLTKIRELS